MLELNTRQVDSEYLGMTRLTEARFENPDESDIAIDHDLLGNKRGKKPVAGPLEGLNAGENTVCVWKYRQ